MKTMEIGSAVERVEKWDPRKSGDRPFVYIDLATIDQQSKSIGEPTFVEPTTAPSRARQLVASGDILVSTVRPNLNAVAQVPPTMDGATASTGFCVLRPTNGQLDSRYLFHWVQAGRFVGEMVRLATGASYPAISDKIVKASRIPAPPIEEQRRIAAVLDAADALRAKRHQAIAKLDTLTQAIFIDMFGDPVSNDRGWPEMSLDEVCTKIQIGPFGSLLHKSDYIEGGIPLVNPMHIVGGEIRPQHDQTVGAEKYAKLQPYVLEPGDVVMGRRGEMGRVAIVGEVASGYLCGSGSLYFRSDPELIIPEYVAAALSGDRGRRELENSSLGVTMPNLNSTIVERFRLGVPPIELQRTFSKALKAHARLSQDQLKQSAEIDTLFASLQQRAFRGEL